MRHKDRLTVRFPGEIGCRKHETERGAFFTRPTMIGKTDRKFMFWGTVPLCERGFWERPLEKQEGCGAETRAKKTAGLPKRGVDRRRFLFFFDHPRFAGCVPAEPASFVMTGKVSLKNFCPATPICNRPLQSIHKHTLIYPHIPSKRCLKTE